MIFLRPELLWFAALALPVTLLFLLRFRRKDKVVPSVYIWERMFKRKAMSALWRRLRKLLSLLIHLLILLFLVFALGRPLMSTSQEIKPRYIAFIIDNSASMQARVGKGGKTRFELAKEEILKAFPHLGSDDKVLLVEAKARPRVAFSMGRNLRELPAALESLKASHSVGNLGQAIRFTSSLIKPHIKGDVEAAVYIYSDGGEIEKLSRKQKDQIELSFYTGRTEEKEEIREVVLFPREEGADSLVVPFEIFLKKIGYLGREKFESTYNAITFKIGESEDDEEVLEIEGGKAWGGVLADLEKIPLYYRSLSEKKILNLAITAFQVRKKFVGLRDYEAMVKVKSFGDKAVTARLSFYFQAFRDNSLGAEKPLEHVYFKEEEFISEPVYAEFTLQPGEERKFFFPRLNSERHRNYKNRKYRMKSGFYFEDEYLEVEGKQVTRAFEGGILKAEIAAVEIKKEDGKEKIVFKEDEFAQDNFAYSVVPRPKEYNVYWINGSQNEFLRALLSIYNEVNLIEIPPDEYMKFGTDRLRFLKEGITDKNGVQYPPHLVIFDHAQPGVKLPPGNYFFLNTLGEGVPLKERQTNEGNPEILEYPIAIKSIKTDHPIMTSVNLEKLFILRCRSVDEPLPPGSEVVVSTYRSPLLVAREGEKGRWVYLGMDPRDSVIVLKNAFILLMTNTIEWLTEENKGSFASSIQAGSHFPLSAREKVVVVDPRGEKYRTDSEGSNVPQTDQIGVYEVRSLPYVGSRDILNWPRFIETLAKAKEGPAQDIFDRFSPSAQKLLKNFDKDRNLEAVKRAVTRNLVKIMQGPLHRADWVSDLTVSEEVKEKIPSRRRVERKKQIEVSRLLLEAAFPKMIKTYEEENRFFAVNLLNPEESRLETQKELEVGDITIESLALAPKREYWSQLALLALIILLVEWYLFSRRRIF